MRNLTKLAIASVLVAGACGVLYPRDDAHRDIAVRLNNKIERQLISQGDGQNDQNLKLLLAAKIFEGRSNIPARKIPVDQSDHVSSSDGKPSS